MRQIDTSTLSNQDISSALLAHTYTADADRELYIRLFADAVAGNGNYTAYLTIQRLGAGSAYQIIPETIVFAGSGVTAVMFLSGVIPIKDTDVLNVYITGLAADTTTPDIITEIWEDDAVIQIGTAGAGLTALGDTRIANLDAAVSTRSTHAAADVWSVSVRSLSTFGTLVADAAAAVWGAAARTLTAFGFTPSLDSAYDAAKTAAQTEPDPAGTAATLLADMALDSTVAKETTLETVAGYLDTEIAAILLDTGTTLPATLTTIDTVVDAIKLKTDTLGGAGAITWTYTLTDSVTGLPIAGAEVWISTDSAGANIIASGTTDDDGVVTFYLDAGVVYVWRKRSGYNFDNPDQETVA